MKSNGRAAGDDDNVDDLEAGPELPPDSDGAEDEEGRFFGGGITTDTADVLDFIDDRDKDGAGVISEQCKSRKSNPLLMSDHRKRRR